jgi:D-sedoheptulose 7-phosphate isomerase
MLTANLTGWVRERIEERNAASDAFFQREAMPLAQASRMLAERFEGGGRLLAFGRGAYATDAQHISVEFVHPVIVGKRALPAMDLSFAFERWVDAILQPEDAVVGFSPPQGDPLVAEVLQRAQTRGAMTFAFPGENGDYAVRSPSTDAHVHQELFELLGHTLYESVHVFFERREMGHDAGASAFLYPFLGSAQQDAETIVQDVAESIHAKARDARGLREQIAARAHEIATAIDAIARELRAGGKLIMFGNGGSATDATDWALDCVMPEDGSAPIPAVSLALEPAILTAVANDVGTEVIFLRQLVAQARPHDVAIALSTSGGSKNVVAALEEARKRKMLTVALLGYDGGEIVRRNLADIFLVVHNQYVPRIQEAQGTIYHLIREGLAEVLRDGS